MEKGNPSFKKIISRTSKNPSIKFLKYKSFSLERDIYNTISVIFNLESALKQGFYPSKKIEVPISGETYSKCNIKEIENQIMELISIVLLYDTNIKLIKERITKKRYDKTYDAGKTDNICLFSGGVDSFSGILKCAEHYNNVKGVFVAHCDQPWTVHIVNNLKNIISDKYGLEIFTVHAPPMYSRGYSQLRGLLYIVLASIYANICESNNIVVTECGPTMYQPRLAPYDAVTMTTHPFILKKAKKIIELFLNKEITITIPHEDMTKAEVISSSPLPEVLKDTYSCITQRFGKSEGACYGCIIRRLGFVAANINDAPYQHNPLLNDGKSDNLLSLINLSSEILLNYDDMDYYMKENIDKFNKKDLFVRFALDNISALYLLNKSGIKINSVLKRFYNAVSSIISEDIFENRIKDIRNKKYAPDYSKTVIY